MGTIASWFGGHCNLDKNLPSLSIACNSMQTKRFLNSWMLHVRFLSTHWWTKTKAPWNPNISTSSFAADIYLMHPNRLCWKLKIMNIFQISDLGISKNPSIVSFQVEPHKVSLHVSIFLRQVHLYTSPKLNSGYFKFVDSTKLYFLHTKSWLWSGEIVKMYFIWMYHDAPSCMFDSHVGKFQTITTFEMWWGSD